MQTRLLGSVVLFLVVPGAAWAQGRPGGGGKPTGGVPGGLPGGSINAPFPGSPNGTNNTDSSMRAIFVSGRVALDDGGELTEPATIQTICRGQRHTAAYTDSKGNFSFQFGDPNSSGTGIGDASTTAITRAESARDLNNWRDCQLQAVLAGFSSEMVELTSRMTMLESTDVGRLSLHRLEHVEGTSLSVTSALAPAAAKKAFAKGREQEKKAKWDEAEKWLQKAVEIYPKYSIAWYELGRLQQLKKDPAAAKNSFEQAIAADPKYVNPYDNLAQLSFQARQWKETVDFTEKLLALNPVNFPSAYFLNGVANYYLQNIDAAEKSVRQGIKVDDGNQVPKLQYMLGMILLHKRDYQGASEHMQQFLRVATQPTDIAEAKKELDEIGRLSANANSSAANRNENEKK